MNKTKIKIITPLLCILIKADANETPYASGNNIGQNYSVTSSYAQASSIANMHNDMNNMNISANDSSIQLGNLNIASTTLNQQQGHTLTDDENYMANFGNDGNVDINNSNIFGPDNPFQ